MTDADPEQPGTDQPRPNQAERDRWNDPSWLRRWARSERLIRSITPVLIAAARLTPGEAVVDLGCGGGLPTIAATRAVGHWGRVVGVDLSAPLLATARSRASAFEEGIRARFVQADVQVEPLPGGPFDVAISQFGIMFFDDPPTAFGSVARSLTPAGRLALAVWQAPDRNPWNLGPVLAQAGIVEPRRPAPGKSPTGPFTWADPAHAGHLLGGCRFGDVVVAPHDQVLEVKVEDVIGDPDPHCADAGDLEALGVPADALPAARHAIGEHLQPYLDAAGGLRLPLAFQIVTARLSPPPGAA